MRNAVTASKARHPRRSSPAFSLRSFILVPVFSALKKHSIRLRSSYRRRCGSVRYAKARCRVAALRTRAARIRHDWQHRASLDIARRFGTVALENLAVRNMTVSAKGTMEAPVRNVHRKADPNRAILNQGRHGFERKLAYRLEVRGGRLRLVGPRHTSRTCSACGAVDGESRESQAPCRCRRCGFRANADHNAALNIMRRNMASMLVEEGQRPSCEARTGRGAETLENPPP